MKVHGSHSSYTAPLLKQSSADSDDDTPFVLPDDQGSSQQKTTVPSVSTTSVASSISSGFWLNQSGSSSTDATTTAASTDSTDSTDDSSSGDLSDDDILSEFAKWANMTPADKIRAQYLEQQNLTEDQFSQLPTDQQNAINKEIADQIKQQLGGSETGATDEDGDSGAVSLG
jgi:hypothetical protein